jgi:hypothetical protein
VASRPTILGPDVRAEAREEVLHRTRVMLADQRHFPVTVVNISLHGMMLRSDAPVSAGEWIKVMLPVIGEAHAAVRWTLGGRIGCELDRPIPAGSFHHMLGTMRA